LVYLGRTTKDFSGLVRVSASRLPGRTSVSVISAHEEVLSVAYVSLAEPSDLGFVSFALDP